MINPVAIIDIVFFLASLCGFIILVKGRKNSLQLDIKILLCSILFFNLMYSLCLLLQWSGVTNILEPYEDLIGALIPMMWAFFFYALLQYMAGKDLKESEGRLRRSNEELENYHQHLESLVEERTAKLGIANRDLSEFAYIVSHDLKAPLRAIGQLSQWLSEDYHESLDEEGRKNLDMLNGRVKRMYRLIDDILAYSRAGRNYERGEQVDIMRLTEEVIDSLMVPENIRVEIENQLPVITGSRIHFQQVIQNLLSNSIKFMDKPEGYISIGCDKQDNFWRFRIKDNGPGIDSKYSKKIFQIFQTLASNQDPESTGIGLTLVKKIVEQYKGKIEMVSEVGKGCTFYFTLPEHI